MKTDQSEAVISELYNDDRLSFLLDRYIEDCSEQSSEEHTEAVTPSASKSPRSQKKQSTGRAIFPNVAGFCRYLGIATDELEPLARSNPTLYGRLLTVFEDEALNSSLSPTLLSAYLKKRLGYDSTVPKQSCEGQFEIRFEHDILKDGE